jgi:hypothetical protein
MNSETKLDISEELCKPAGKFAGNARGGWGHKLPGQIYLKMPAGAS